MHKDLLIIKENIEMLRKSGRFTLKKLITSVGEKHIEDVLRELDEKNKLSGTKIASILCIERHSLARLRKLMNLPQLSRKIYFIKGY